MCAGAMESAAILAKMSLQVGAADHVSSFKNTERSNWKSRVSTGCSEYLRSIISCVRIVCVESFDCMY